MKVITLLGTRPEIIRLSRIITLLDEYFDHKIIHTGQNYDYELNEIFFKDLGLRKPDYFLGVKADTLGKMIGNVISESEKILIQEKPDAILILGDTNSSLATIISKRLKIPIYHMEAGNRSFDNNVPEEINRKIVDHISDFNIVYTEHARRNLLAEGIKSRFVYLSGSPLFEVINYYKSKIDNSKILSELNLKKDDYLLVSLHREENVDNPDYLSNLVDLLNDLTEHFSKKILFSVHPRTKNRLAQNKNLELNKNIIMHKPFGFIDYVNLQLNSFCVLSDSGTISEEAAILNFPAVTVRNSMERPEALDFGNIIITGFDKEVVIKSIEVTRDYKLLNINDIPSEYKVKDVSWRILKLILGTSKLSNKWYNINKN